MESILNGLVKAVGGAIKGDGADVGKGIYSITIGTISVVASAVVGHEIGKALDEHGKSVSRN